MLCIEHKSNMVNIAKWSEFRMLSPCIRAAQHSRAGLSEWNRRRALMRVADMRIARQSRAIGSDAANNHPPCHPPIHSQAIAVHRLYLLSAFAAMLAKILWICDALGRAANERKKKKKIMFYRNPNVAAINFLSECCAAPDMPRAHARAFAEEWGIRKIEHSFDSPRPWQ